MGRDGADYSQQAPQDSGEHSGFSFSSIMGKAKELGGKALDTTREVAAKPLKVPKRQAARPAQ